MDTSLKSPEKGCCFSLRPESVWCRPRHVEQVGSYDARLPHSGGISTCGFVPAFRRISSCERPRRGAVPRAQFKYAYSPLRWIHNRSTPEAKRHGILFFDEHAAHRPGVGVSAPRAQHALGPARRFAAPSITHVDGASLTTVESYVAFALRHSPRSRSRSYGICTNSVPRSRSSGSIRVSDLSARLASRVQLPRSVEVRATLRYISRGPALRGSPGSDSWRPWAFRAR